MTVFGQLEWHISHTIYIWLINAGYLDFSKQKLQIIWSGDDISSTGYLYIDNQEVRQWS